MVKNFDEYFEGRFADQQNWYSRKASWNKTWYRRLRVAVVTLAAAIPITVSVLPTSSPLSVPVLYILSFLLITTEAILSTSNLQENWMNYRTTSEALKKEREYFRTGTGPYADRNDDDTEALFIERVEDLISTEHRVWRISTEREREEASESSGSDFVREV